MAWVCTEENTGLLVDFFGVRGLSSRHLMEQVTREQSFGLLWAQSAIEIEISPPALSATEF